MGTIDIRVPKEPRRQQEQLRARQMARDIQREQVKVYRPHQVRARLTHVGYVVTVSSREATDQQLIDALTKLGFRDMRPHTGPDRFGVVRKFRPVVSKIDNPRGKTMSPTKVGLVRMPEAKSEADADLVIDKDAKAFKDLEDAYAHGERVSATGMTSAQFMAAILGTTPGK